MTSKSKHVVGAWCGIRRIIQMEKKKRFLNRMSFVGLEKIYGYYHLFLYMSFKKI